MLNMKIAVPYENGQIFQHFGHATQLKIYEVRDDEILSKKVINTNGSGHGELVQELKDHHINVLLCGGIGVPAVLALREAGIQILGGATGEADQQVQDFLNGKLHFESEATCGGHHHGNGDGCEHECDGNISACGTCCH